jgi:hypothetical protein
MWGKWFEMYITLPDKVLKVRRPSDFDLNGEFAKELPC